MSHVEDIGKRVINKTYVRLFFGVTILVTLICSTIFLYYIRQNCEDKLKKNVIKEAKLVANSLNPDLLKELTGTAQDTSLAVYIELKKRFHTIKDKDTNYKFIYLWGGNSENIMFLVDSEEPDTKGYSPPGQVYQSATLSDKKPFLDGKDIVSGPSKDDWGEWVTPLIPIKDESTGKLIVILGMDISSNDWDLQINKESIIPFFLAVFINLLIIGFYFFYIRIITSRNIIAESEYALKISENNYRSIVNNIQDVFIRIDTEFKVLMISPSAIEELKLRSLDDMFDQNIKKFWANPVDFPSFIEFLDSQLPMDDYEFQFKLNSGDAIYIQCAMHPIYNELGIKIGYEGIWRNINKRKIFEKALIESEQKFKSIFLGSSDPMSLIDSNGIVECNPALTKLLGYNTEAELIGKHPIDLSPKYQSDGGLSSEKAVARINKCLEKGNYVFEWMHLNKKGQEIPTEISLTTIDYSEKFKIFAIWRDISERKISEKELEDYTNRLQNESQLLNNFIGFNPISIEILNIEGYPQKVNKALIDLFGEAPPKEYSILKDPILIENGIVECVEQVKKGNTVYMPEFYYNAKKVYPFMADKPIYIKIVAFPLTNKNSEVESIVLMHQNITEQKKIELALKESEEKYKLIVEFSHDAIFILSEFKIVFVNKAFVNLSGYSEEEALGQSFDDFVHADDLIFVKANYQKRRNDEEVPAFYEFRFINKNKQVSYVNVSAVIINFGGKKANLGALRDVSKEKMAQVEKDALLEKLKFYNMQIETALSQKDALIDELNNTKETLMVSNLEKDKFFSIIAHDLRSPFSGFLNLTKTMSESLLDLSLHEMQEYTRDLQDQADHLYKLLENLLEWAKIQRGSISFNPDVYDLGLITNNIFEISKINAFQKDLTLINEIEKDIKVYADLNMLHTSLRNLISNAMKFTPRGGSITLKAEKKVRFVEISVIDTGVGMSEDIIEKLFRIDQKVSRPGTEGEASSGLGLLLCKEFIEKNSGKIWVESEVNKGSKFTFTLPLKDDSALCIM